VCIIIIYNDFLILLIYVADMLIVEHDAKKIKGLEKELRRAFAIKDLGPVRQILCMRITRDMKNIKLWLSREKHIGKVLERFVTSTCKLVNTLLAGYFKLSNEENLTSGEEKK